MKLDAISIVTADMSRAVPFYQALGLDLTDGGPDAPHSELSTGSIRLLLDTEEVIRTMDPEWTRPTGGHVMSLAFDCDTAEAVDATFTELTSASGGAEPVAAAVMEPWDAFWGQRYAVIADPDGNTVDLFAAQS